MVRLLTLALVFVLSGVPAVAMTCDLFVCGAPAASTCHERSAPASARSVTATPERCTHLALADPYLTSAWRIVLQERVAAEMVPAIPEVWRTGGAAAGTHRTHGPPDCRRVATVLPLRI